LSPNNLPTKNRNEYELRDKSEIKECVLGGSLFDMGFHGTEKIEQENITMAKQNSLSRYFVVS